MSTVHALAFALGLLLSSAQGERAPPPARDIARLREMLANRQHPLLQNQAAVLLAQDRSHEAEAVIREQLRKAEAPEVFVALAGALRLCRDNRFTPELFAALASDQADVRQEAARTLAVLADSRVLRRLRTLCNDPAADPAARQTAVLALGRNGSLEATAILMELAARDTPTIHQAAVEALTELTGQTFGNDVAGWQTWWKARQHLSREQWLAERLGYQGSHARRLEGDLEQARTEVLRLHQQLYARLPAADRLGYVQGLRHHEDARVRLLAAGWCGDLLAAADAVGRSALAETLLGFSQDTDLEVQRAAVLSLGRVNEWRVLERLRLLLSTGRPSVRAAAARALTQLAAGQWRSRKVSPPDNPGATADPPPLARAEVIPALQKALDDPALEVVVEAAEDLGSLGVSEAGPVLTALLRHPSEPVRQTAARALERVADRGVLDDLLRALDDPSVSVRFSVVGAVGHAVGDGRRLDDAVRGRLLGRLQDLLLRDPDPGVRSRAATVIGECGVPGVMVVLWQRILAAEDTRVQDKAWAAATAILVRSASLKLLTEWDRRLAAAKQGPRRLQLLNAVCEAWRKGDETRGLVGPATELLVQAELDQNQWAVALPLVRELLSRPSAPAEVDRRLAWLRTIAVQALSDGSRPEALQAISLAQPLLAGHPQLLTEFQRLEKQARRAE
jgi:HEAT repeat protein